MNNQNESYLEKLSVSETMRFCNEDFFVSKELSIKEVEDGIVLPPVSWKKI